MKQKSVGLTLRALILALVLSLVAGTPALPPLDGVAYAQSSGSGLTATLAPDGSSVNLTWTAVTGADSYEIWRGEVVNNNAQWGSSAYATVTGEDTTTYTDSIVTAGTTYAYAVRSVTDGTAASWTGPYPNVTIGGGVAAPTAAPSVTVAADGNTAVDVSWTSVTGATGYYIQFWHAGLGNQWSRISGSQTSPYKHTGLTPGTEYYYVVAAWNDGGEGPWSSWRDDDSKITLQATTAVPELTLTRVDRTTARLEWTRTANAAQYELQRRKITTAFNSDGTAEKEPNPDSDPPEAPGWARLGDLLTVNNYIDSAANYVPVTDNNSYDITVDPDMAMKVNYEYRVRAIDSQGINGNWSKVKGISVPAGGAVLDAPANVSASTVSATSIQVSWDAVDGADLYQVQWKSGDRGWSDPIDVEPPDSGRPLYNHPGLTASTKYTYRVRAVDVNGAGDYSAEKSATTLGTTDTAGQMPQVTGLTVTDVTASNTGATRTARLTWNAVSGATHYHIQRFDPSATTPLWQDLTTTVATTSGSFTSITKATATSSPNYEDDDFSTTAGYAAGKTFYYVVSAVDDRSGDFPAQVSTPNPDDDIMGEWSAYQSVTFKAHKPNPPANLDAEKASADSILVIWTTGGTTAATNGDLRGEPSSYTLQWRTSQTSTWSSISPASSPYHHTGLRGNTTYYYRVRAQNSGGESAYHPLNTETQVSVTLGHTLNPPRGLSVVDATTGEIPRLKVTWTAAAGADSYEIQRWHVGSDSANTENTSNTNDEWASLTGAQSASGVRTFSSVGGTTVTDDGDELAGVPGSAILRPNRTYYYRVRSVRETDTKSVWSDVVKGSTKRAALTTPVLQATTTGQSMIRLSWKPVGGATSYELQYAEGAYTSGDNSGGLGFTGVNVTTIDVASSLNHHVHTGLKPGTQYSYRLRALGANDVKSGWSATPVQPFTKPAQPQLTAVEPTVSSIKLKWDAVKFSGATGGRLTAAGEYRIERRASGVATWTNVPTDGTADALESAVTCPGNKCSFTDHSLDDGTTYFYRIRAETSQSVNLGGGDATVLYTSYWDNANQRTPAE